MTSFSLTDLLKGAGRRMRADLAERLVPHPGELGTGREAVVRQFLRAYLPSRFESSTGFAFDSHGTASQQLDIIIADASICPRFETAGGKRFYPCESIVAVGQVKSSLRTKREFREAMENLESVKSLDRSAGGTAIDLRFGENLDPLHNHLHQVFTFLFVIGDALAPDTMHEELLDHVLRTAAHVWPNVILSLDRYLVTFCCDSGICPNPMDARGVALQRATDDDEILMRFYILLGRALEVTRISGFPYWEYLHYARSWNAKIWYSSTDDPPPYLSAITTG
jgi:hypothetical protein